MKSETPLISVIIPVRNRTECLLECLRGLFQQSVSSDLQVIIIDDASTQNGPHELANTYHIEYYRNDKRYGSGYSKNVGLRYAKGENILFLDSDINFFSNTTLETELNALYSLPNCGEVGGEALLDQNNIPKFIFGRNIDLRTGKSSCNYVCINTGSHSKNFWEFDYIPTSNCLLRRETVIKVRGFDDAYNCLGEDKDFGYRVKKINFKNYVLRDSVIFHKFSKDGRNSKGLKKQYRTQIRFYLRHFGYAETLKMVLHFSKILISDRIKPIQSNNPTDPDLGKFEQYYRSEILGFSSTGPSTLPKRLKDGANCISEFWSAYFWNIGHRKGLKIEGSCWFDKLC